MRGILSFWRRYRDVSDLLGPWRTLALTPGWLLFREFVVVEHDLREPLPDVHRPAGLSFRLLAPVDRARLSEINPSLSHAEIARRFNEGEVCLVGWLGREPVYYHWWITARPPFLSFIRLPLLLEPSVLLSGDVFTRQAFRGQGIGRAGKVEAWRWARDQGYRREIGFAAVWNVPSLRLSRSIGRRPVARVGWWQLGPWRRYVLRGAARLERGALIIHAEPARPRTDA
jgi:GNAT superfamily N-acetyltransferase